MRSSYWMAFGVTLAATAWIASGQLGARDAPGDGGKAPAAKVEAASPALAAVRVRTAQASETQRLVLLRGRTEPNRTVTIRSETIGRVITIGAERGARIAEGALIVRLAEDDRAARLAEAKALLAQREAEFRASQALSERGYRPDNQHAAARAQLGAARALVARIELDISRTEIKAPFRGVLDKRAVEIGDYLKEGDTIATLVDLDPILVVGFLTETDRGKVKEGQVGRARLATGKELAVKVRYLAAAADAATRTFRVELEAPNPDLSAVGGVTAEITIPVERVLAHRITPALLSLDERGVVGVKTVDESDIARFHPVEIISDGPEGMWVTGLPDTARIITVGHEYARPGQKVRPVPDDAAPGT